ncbi:MAG TPA: ABC transporter permease [Thermomicrobiales bacterium]|nr:ABC transporter permease [Thermomicrobiales bacterium]
MVDRRSTLAWIAGGFLLALVTVSVTAPSLAPHDPRLTTGIPLTPPSRSHPLGTNDLGQDVLSQLIFGARAALIVAAVVAGISTVLSWTVGLMAGYFRRAEAPLMAVTDLLLALPNIPLYLLVLTLLGPSRRNLILVLGLLSWPAFARVVRSVVLQARSAPYVEASKALGASGLFIVHRHVLPATLDVLPTKIVLTVRFAVFAEATLAFLGLGSAGTISWGTMLNWAFADPLLFERPVWPWLVLPPTFAIMSLILATVWLSDGITRARAGVIRRPRRNTSSQKVVAPRRPRLTLTPAARPRFAPSGRRRSCTRRR